MRRFQSTVLLTIPLLVLLGTGRGFALDREAADQAIRDLLAPADSVVATRIELDDATVEAILREGIAAPQRIPVWVAYRDGGIVRYATVRAPMGRFEPFYIALAVDTALTVSGTIVLEYNSPYGSEVRREGFRKQFVGKVDSDPLKPGADIDAITGATISARSYAEEIHDTLRLFDHLYDAGLIRFRR